MEKNPFVNEEIEDEEQIEDWDDWNADDEEGSELNFRCLFCDLKWSSVEPLFQHCRSNHAFDFHSIRKCLRLDFYDSFKLINYVRSQVAANKCWCCGLTFQSNQNLQNHLHPAIDYENDGKLPWKDDIYLKPFIQDDALLHSFGEDEDDTDDYTPLFDKEELLKELGIANDFAAVCLEDRSGVKTVSSKNGYLNENGSSEAYQELYDTPNNSDFKEMVTNNATLLGEEDRLHFQKQKDKSLKVSFANVAAREIKTVNEGYFGAYSSFGIHREMISDKVRTDSYREAILKNPSVMKNATVMDVGCGTGILSLFAAEAGASRVYAVEASEKMAAVATQIAKDNGLLWEESQKEKNNSGVITVVHSMVEELDKTIQVEPHSIDVLISEWMGYCLLYESMLSSVLYARDRWLKPGGAILPDIATMYAAGFGRGATSVPFWENVYGFDMSCIGKEVAQDAAQLPIVDVVDSRDLVTETAVVKTFDLATMEPDEMDFTSSFELEPKFDFSGDSKVSESSTSWCYGIVLWFETAFTSRFCTETPTILSTSPHKTKTHWSQTIFTFKDPIAITTSESATNSEDAVGSDTCPATRIRLRVSIVKAAQHRSIDISLEISGISADGRKRSWPVKIFNLC